MKIQMKKILCLLFLSNIPLALSCESNQPVVVGYRVGCIFMPESHYNFATYPHQREDYSVHQRSIVDENFDTVHLILDATDKIVEITKHRVMPMTEDDFIEKYVDLEEGYFKIKTDLIQKFGEPIESREILPFPDLESGAPVFYSVAKFMKDDSQVALHLLSGDFENGQGSANLSISYTEMIDFNDHW